ncbi:MAG TPA: STAS domain-containing protein [Methanoregulaceae archaeon]|nr:STAS domain-containing protein [Methanoregulaceae archaeon]HPD74636.1 STAS domain-containing protein [Methanoregulaceae archaeon]HRY74906.1 STAS domain-containing protein [Methanoregulaceae archaeon]
MTLEITGDEETVYVIMPKRMDAENAPSLEQDLKALALWKSPVVVFDFSSTDYIASAGLRVLLVTIRTLGKSGAKTGLAGLKPQVYKVFDMAGFTQIFSIFKTREEAVAKLG